MLTFNRILVAVDGRLEGVIGIGDSGRMCCLRNRFGDTGIDLVAK